MRFSKLLTHRVVMLLCCREHTPAESVTHCEAERGNQLLSRSGGSRGESPHQWRSANSFSASPTANPVGARKRKGWFVVLQSCDRLAPTRSSPRAFVRNRGHGFACDCRAHYRRRRHRARSNDHVADYVGHHDHSRRHYPRGDFDQRVDLEVLLSIVRHPAALPRDAR